MSITDHQDKLQLTEIASVTEENTVLDGFLPV